MWQKRDSRHNGQRNRTRRGERGDIGDKTFRTFFLNETWWRCFTVSSDFSIGPFYLILVKISKSERLNFGSADRLLKRRPKGEGRNTHESPTKQTCVSRIWNHFNNKTDVVVGMPSPHTFPEFLARFWPLGRRTRFRFVEEIIRRKMEFHFERLGDEQMTSILSLEDAVL